MALLFICNGHTAQTQNIINEMGEWLIYGSNGTQKATVKKLEYSGEFMGETSVTCDIYSPSPISFSIGDYLVYRGERFTIDYDATRLKQSRNNTYGKGYTYENMRFLSYVGELKKCEFLDFVPSDNLIHFSQLPDFSFYAETVKDLADRLQANLDRIYTGSKAWSVQVVQGFEGKENINVSVSKATCFDALRMAYDQFEATFIIRGRTITIGTAGNELETDFKYGKGNGLKTIERSVDESDSLVTRLRAYGNTTNLPANYYKNIGMRVYAPIYEIYHVSTTGCDIHFVPKLKNACFSDKNDQYNYWVTVSLDETLWLKAVASPNNHLSSTAYSVVTVGLYGSNTQAQVTQFLNQLQSGTYDKLYFKEGINVGAWPVEYREYAENVPNLMAIDRLMLPGFPELTTDPYIDASNISTLGVREKSVYFDGSDPDTPDIHPTLEGMTADELRAAGYTIDLDAGDNGNLDEIAADATETDGSPITADGAFEGVDEVPGFKVSIKDIGFDINDYLSTETATLVMKTGMCGGREFTIVKVEKVGNKYVLECQRTEDVSHYFPYNPYLIKAGDKFVLTNIEMPKAYIDAASQRLLAAAQAYIAKYSAPQWVYAIKMDDIWMQRQRDNSASEASSYYWNIKEGDVMNVTDSDLGVDISEVIDRLTIREGYGPIPEFEVVLRKEKPQGTIGVLQNRIRQLELRNAEQVDIIRRQQNYLTFIFGDTLADVMSQLDKKAETWYQASDPSSAWTNDEDKAEHVGDLWMDISANGGKKTYIYQNTGTSDSPNYQWVEQFVPDEVFDEIDGKAEIFVEKPTSYHERDMWIIENGISSSDLPAGCVAGDIVISSTDSTSFNKAHWSKKDRYTDDSSLNAFISGTYADNLQEIQTQIDGKAETWYQNTDPSTVWTTTALKNQHEGDIWHNSSTSTINGVKAGQDAIWNGTAWVVDETVPQSVYDTIDGKAAIYVTWGAWGDDLQVKDLFIPSANTTQGGVTYKANKVYRCTNKSTPTFQEIAYTDDAALNAFLNGYTGTLTGIRSDITTAQTTANNANTAAAAAQATADALDYLKQAYSADNTLIDHGLILSTIVALRDSSNNVWSGISGAYDSTKLGNGIAAWYGGGMIDGEVSQVANAAKSLFRFDGSGYVASGNLKWDANGNVTIQGYSINATTLQVGGSNVATQAMLDNFVSKAFFNRLFTAYDANGNAIVPNDTTTAINNLKLMVGTWTEEYLSALGKNSEGGGGGDFDEAQMWTALQSTSGTYATTKIATSHIPDMASAYGYLKASALSGYATQSWVNQQGFLTSHQTLYTLSIYGGTTKVLDFKPNADASIYIKAGGDISLTNDTTNKHITLSYTHPTNGANTTISAASGKVLSAITVNSLGHVTSVSSKTLASADIPDISATYATASRATTLEGYFNSGGVAKVAAKLNTGTTTYTAWGQTYWSSGVPQSISGNMTSVGSITPSANGNALGTTSARFNIYGTAGNFSGNVSIGGTLGVTGATTLTGLLTANGGIVVPSSKTIKIGDCTISWDSTNSMLKFDTGIYSTGAVSALGSNSSGGGSGTFDEEAMWTALGTTSTAKVIASSHIPNLNARKITSGTLADARIPSLTASKITSGTFDTARIPNLSADKITSGTFAAARIPDLSATYATVSSLGNYLPLTGGTITLASIDGLTINKSNNAAGMIRFTNGSTLLGYLGYYGAGVPACNIGGNYRALLHTDNFGNFAYALYGGTNLSPSESNVVDLNTITDYGSYYCATIASASYVENKPTGSTAFRLWVSCPLGTSSDYIRQRYQGYAQIQAFERYSNNSGSTWSAWYRCQADVDSEFLPLTGGTLTGSLTVNNNSVTALGYNIKFEVDTSREVGIGWLNTSGTKVASVIYHNTAQNIIINPIGSANTYSDAVGKYSLFIGNNKLTYNTYTILHSNNTYVSSGKGYINGTEITTISGNAATASLLSYSHTNEINFKGGMQETCYFNFRNADSDSQDGGTTAINYKFCNYTRETAYSTVTAGTFIGAFSGNATTATTLQTSRTIWGESFNGSADVSGAMTGVTSITMSSHIIMNNNTSVYIKDTNGTALRMLTVNNSNQYFLGFDAKQNGYNGYIDANNLYLRCTTALYLQTSLVTLNAGARISKGAASGSILYIGDTNNSGWVCLQDMCSQTATGDTYWSIRNGGNAVFKEVTSTSDERRKNIISNTKFNVKDIASARSVLFEWKDDKSKKVHGGSIAQDWLGIADSFITEGDTGYYSLNYGALALCSAITIAREVLKHEDRITLLEKENARLKARVAELEERRIA